MQIASLGSGSKGNSTIVRCGDRRVLIDCGFSLSQFEKRLQRLSVVAADIDAILVTHEHSDHGAGVARLAGKYQLPVYSTIGTARALDLQDFQVISGGQQLLLGSGLQVQVVTVPHDAAEPVQFVFVDSEHNRRLGVLTDCGHISSHMRQAYDHLDGLLLEFNYDEDMLLNGPYPPSLQQRISSGFGHLSNLQSIDLLKQVNTRSLQCLIAGHLSEKNNSPRIVADLLEQQDIGTNTLLACQQQGFEWVQL